MDVDAIEPGLDFVEVIEKAVGSCDALIVLIGAQWLTATDAEGHVRLENPEDFVRLEIEAALERNIRTIPVLVGGATMPRSAELPEPVKPFARRNALEVSDTRFKYDVGRLVEVLDSVLSQDSQKPSVLPTELEEAPNKSVPEETFSGTGSARPRMLRMLRHPEGVKTIAFSPNGEMLVTGCGKYFFGEHAVRLWRVSNGELVHTMKGHTATVKSVAFSPDGSTIASGSEDNTVRFWQVSDGKPVGLPRTFEGPVQAVAFSPDGETMVSASGHTAHSVVQLWRLDNGKLIFNRDEDKLVQAVAISPDGALGASTRGMIGLDEDEPVQLWRVSDGITIRVLEHTPAENVAFSPDGEMLACASDNLSLWRVSDGEPLMVVEGLTRSVAFSCDGSILAWTADKALKLLRVADGKLLHTLEGHTKQVSSIAFSPSGNMLASGSDDDTVRLWSLE